VTPSNSNPIAPSATVVISPRDRFGAARRSLESIFEHTPTPYDLVYVDPGSPAHLRQWIAEQATEKGFRHIVLDRFVSPNEARNIGAAGARTPYVVFVDNDVIVSPGWLEALVSCADETGAGVVAPLTCEGEPVHQEIHQAGGRFADDVDAFFATPEGERDLFDETTLQGAKVSEVASQLKRGRTQTSEFHCVLVRRSALEAIGGLDPEMLATKEYLDLALSMAKAGETVWFEPSSVVTFLHPSSSDPVTPEDWPYFILRWSPEWQRRSMQRLKEKWGLRPDGFVQRRRAYFGWRHFEGILKPQLRATPLLGRMPLWTKVGKRAFSPLIAAAAAAAVAADDRRRRATASRRA
jgi:GT2 family glycosyltransferase